MVHTFVSVPNFVSVTPSMGVLFPILRRGKVSTLWSLFFLSFMCFANELHIKPETLKLIEEKVGKSLKVWAQGKNS